jgi:uncharacterized membrane protein YhaH (DUF805 family)
MRELLFPRTLGRLAYLWRQLPLSLFGLFQLSHFEMVDEWTSREIGLLGLFIVTLVYGILYVDLPRIRDCGMSPWTWLLALIPYVSNFLGLILCFKASAVLRVGMRSIPTSDMDTTRRCSLYGRMLEQSDDDGSGSFCLDCSSISPAP